MPLEIVPAVYVGNPSQARNGAPSEWFVRLSLLPRSAAHPASGFLSFPVDLTNSGSSSLPSLEVRFRRIALAATRQPAAFSSVDITATSESLTGSKVASFIWLLF